MGTARPGAGGAIPRELRPFELPVPELEDQRTPTPAPNLMPTPNPAPSDAPADSPPPNVSSMRSPASQSVRSTPAQESLPVLGPPSPRPNPFDVQPTSLAEPTESTQVDPKSDLEPPPSVHRSDPPPPLPKKLWAYHQENGTPLSAQLIGLPNEVPTGPKFARLPAPSRKTDHAVTQASAIQPASSATVAVGVVTADGTDAEASGQVVPAVHFAPLDE